MSVRHDRIGRPHLAVQSLKGRPAREQERGGGLVAGSRGKVQRRLLVSVSEQHRVLRRVEQRCERLHRPGGSALVHRGIAGLVPQPRVRAAGEEQPHRVDGIRSGSRVEEAAAGGLRRAGSHACVGTRTLAAAPGPKLLVRARYRRSGVQVGSRQLDRAKGQGALNAGVLHHSSPRQIPSTPAKLILCYYHSIRCPEQKIAEPSRGLGQNAGRCRMMMCDSRVEMDIARGAPHQSRQKCPARCQPGARTRRERHHSWRWQRPGRPELRAKLPPQRRS